ncbi:hypothetical protein GJ496_009544 [Pomphorhynchus laevis]|nr:hypothetical protein GJ496_009544 [Pomphorhynchus laevis]
MSKHHKNLLCKTAKKSENVVIDKDFLAKFFNGSWEIQNGWLKPYYGEIKVYIPVVAVRNVNKNKVRLVLDFRELNRFVSNHSAESQVCFKTIREWRQAGNNTSQLDLRSVYLQIRRNYTLTRLGFDLNVAPKIMVPILRHVLALDSLVACLTSFYMDDILVMNDRVLNEHWRKLLSKQVICVDADGITKRSLFAICGSLIGHFPVARWLRPCWSYLKRMANTYQWDETLDQNIKVMFKYMVVRLKKDDPVSGAWEVNNITKQGGTLVDDASSLRVADDPHQINLAELDTIVKGLSLALDWNLRDVSIMKDSKCVYRWGNSAALVKRRLAIIRSLQEDSDALTRVPENWFKIRTSSRTRVFSAHVAIGDIKREHERHHLGVDRSLYLARRSLSADSVEKTSITWYEIVSSVNRLFQLQYTKGELGGQDYLSIIDAGSSRFNIWKELKRMTAPEIISKLLEVFWDRGFPGKIIADNATVFGAKEFREFANQNVIKVIYRCAYKPNTNGIIERCHRTIQRMFVRTLGFVQEMVFWYNASPKNGTNLATAPMSEVYKYDK